MAGENPFILNDGSLQLHFKPGLPGWLFPENGQLSFTFLGSIPITYHNPRKANTWELEPTRITLTRGEDTIHLKGTIIPAPYAAEVREKIVTRIDVYW